MARPVLRAWYTDRDIGDNAARSARRRPQSRDVGSDARLLLVERFAHSRLDLTRRTLEFDVQRHHGGIALAVAQEGCAFGRKPQGLLRHRSPLLAQMCEAALGLGEVDLGVRLAGRGDGGQTYGPEAQCPSPTRARGQATRHWRRHASSTGALSAGARPPQPNTSREMISRWTSDVPPKIV